MKVGSYLNAPWVKPIAAWARSGGPGFLRLVGVGIGIVTIVISLAAPESVVLLWVVYLLAP